MKEKEIKSVISERISQGELKSDLFVEFKDQIEENSLRNFLASKPSFELWSKYKNVHLVLSIIWGVFILLELFGLFDLFENFDLQYLISLVISLYIATHIWKFDGRFFLPGIIWFALTIFNVFKETYSVVPIDSEFRILVFFAIGYSVVLVIGMFLMFYIKAKVFPYFNWFKPKTNKHDEILFE